VALSPDGKTVACGGWTGAEWDRSLSIYLFDRASGRMLRRLSGVPNVINHLAYSPDGRFLVAAMGSAHGVRVYEAAGGSLIAELQGYGDSSYGAAFDRDGRLFTTSYDGFVRRYDAQFKLIDKSKPPGGAKPFGISVSPQGDRMAVGFQDMPHVTVLSAKDLSVLSSPDTRGVTGNLASVAWSDDGRLLYASGTHRINGVHPVRVWDGGGRGTPRDLPAAHSTIFHLLSLSTGGVAFGAADPAVGAFDAAERRVVFHGPPLADYADVGERFRLSADGTAVQFSYEAGGASPVRFSLGTRLLEPATSGDRILAPPLLEADGLRVTGWKKSSSPKLNDRLIALDQHEEAFSLAIAQDHQTFVLGTNWLLRLFDRHGAVRWKTAVPAPVLGVNIGGEKVVVAALGDGTIRWYRLDGGQELLALFPHPDRKRWVLWTPAGYYDAAPAAEALIGWHVNRGRETAADFFPVNQFRSTYYRPDVVRRVLDTLDPNEALLLANSEAGRRPQEVALTQQLPPVIRILTPEDGAPVSTPEVTLRVAARSSLPVTGLKVLVDGRPNAAQRGVRIEKPARVDGELVHTLRVAMPERDAEVSVIAENQSAVSAPATVRLRWRGSAPTGEFVVKPVLYVLAIGVSQYQSKDLTLEFAAKDARDFVSALVKQKGGLYREVVAKVLTDAQATKEEILDGLDWLRKETTGKDVAVLFLAGHGVNDQSGIYYFLPANANLDKLMRTGIPFSDIKNTVSTLAGKTLAFVDTCHSGNVMGKRRGLADVNSVVNELASAENGAVVFASSTGNQYSLERSDWGNGAFTKALVEGLNGGADYSGKGKISINMLDLYLSERVKELTKGQQTPTTTKPQTVPDFPIAMRP
jgi:WD40 repeat protein